MMYKKTELLCVGFLLAAFFAGCNTQQTEEKNTTQVVGNDRDDHGCIASAGYQWSELKKDCVRPWEQGVKLEIAADTNATSAAYLVLSPDTAQLEVFLPKDERHPILSRDVIGHAESWSSTERKNLSVEHHDGKWTIFYKGKMIFTQK